MTTEHNTPTRRIPLVTPTTNKEKLAYVLESLEQSQEIVKSILKVGEYYLEHGARQTVEYGRLMDSTRDLKVSLEQAIEQADTALECAEKSLGKALALKVELP